MALVMRVAGTVSSDRLRNDIADTTLIMQWSKRKRSSERTLRATGGLTAMTTVSLESRTSWFDDAIDTAGQRLERSVAIARLRGDSWIESTWVSDDLSPVTMADVISPVPTNPNLINFAPSSAAAIGIDISLLQTIGPRRLVRCGTATRLVPWVELLWLDDAQSFYLTKVPFVEGGNAASTFQCGCADK